MDEKLDTWLHDREDYATTSSRLRELVEKSGGRMTLWDACKALGWSINKGKNIVEHMIDSGDIYMTKSERNGHVVKILSTKPVSSDEATIPGAVSKIDVSTGAQIAVQNELINAIIDSSMKDIKEYLEKYFDLSNIPGDIIAKMNVGTVLLNHAAKKIGFAGGIADDRLKKLITR